MSCLAGDEDDLGGPEGPAAATYEAKCPSLHALAHLCLTLTGPFSVPFRFILCFVSSLPGMLWSWFYCLVSPMT